MKKGLLGLDADRLLPWCPDMKMLPFLSISSRHLPLYEESSPMSFLAQFLLYLFRMYAPLNFVNVTPSHLRHRLSEQAYGFEDGTDVKTRRDTEPQ
jgi:hypothetical protein